mmetsp:Transcript_28949/g.32847  ORF Transcript_28949/g.32847 Transcript_28949/m.32847 type:complete len:668 (-) Transcript_28949:1007-3010(-)
MDNKMDSSSTPPPPPPPPPPTSSKITPCCYSYNTNSRRGICNVSKVSCHISCAVQILCHAIPTVHFTLLRIAVEEEERIRKEGKTFHQDLDSFPSSSSSLSSSSSSLLLRELVDFIRGGKQQNDDHNDDDDDDDANNINDPNQDNSKSKVGSLFPSPWNPRRLYIYLQQENVGTSILLDSNQVGDATTSLSGLLQFLSKESGSAWKNILNASIWEGEVRQVLEGRRPISNKFATMLDTMTPLVDNVSDENTEIILPQRRFLQRIKTSTKNKSMASPLVLKFRHTNCDSSHQQHQQQLQQCKDDSSRTGWSIIKALNEIIQPQRIQGTSYPWETLSPDSYSEREVICRDYFQNKKCTGKDDDDNDDDDVEWITTKRIEIQRIPRVWLLHLDRPKFSVKRFRRSLSDQFISSVRQAQAKEEVDLEERDLSSSSFFIFDHVDVALTLNMSIFEKAAATDPVCSIDGATSFHCQNLPLSSSPTNLVLKGAIVQVIEIDDDDGDSEEDWEGGHSITLLPNEKSWLLIDDDSCQPIPESQAIRMMGGVARVEDGNRGRENDYTYFAASLLVYSIPEDNTQYDEEWKQHADKVLSFWKENKSTTNTATVTEDSLLLLVGKRLRVRWGKGKYYSGIITLYNQSTGKHRVAYDDGEVKDYVLAKKTIEWINEDNSL